MWRSGSTEDEAVRDPSVGAASPSARAVRDPSVEAASPSAGVEATSPSTVALGDRLELMLADEGLRGVYDMSGEWTSLHHAVERTKKDASAYDLVVQVPCCSSL